MSKTRQNDHELHPIISTRTWKSNMLIPIINVSQPTSNGHCNLLKQSIL